ncbi:hypothetical protein OCU04_003974 [Sclerotinia nivalis]|uniref:Uncharacterized protein n=1 Tax=Sclerotinia nivalis TaxID=352851 RepID=A0A9X0DN97_9HELO|nr:hypothetical protein OCU04_003974 [Sclerotinia nivalis]
MSTKPASTSTSTTAPDPTLIINRPRPQTWIFIPPPSPSSPLTTNLETASQPNSDTFPPYPPPPTRPPPLAPFASPAQTHITSPGTRTAEGNLHSGACNRMSISIGIKKSECISGWEKQEGMEKGGQKQDKEKEKDDEDITPPFTQALFFDSLQSDSNTPRSKSPSISISPSLNSSSMSNSNSNPNSSSSTPQPQLFHSISHCRPSQPSQPSQPSKPSKPSPPTPTPSRTQNRPPIPNPIPLIRNFSSSEFHTHPTSHPTSHPPSHSHQHPDKDLNDWVIIPPDIYYSPSSPSPPHSSPPISSPPSTSHQEVTPQQEEKQKQKQKQEQEQEHKTPEIIDSTQEKEKAKEKERKISTLGYLFNFLISTKGYGYNTPENAEN